MGKDLGTTRGNGQKRTNYGDVADEKAKERTKHRAIPDETVIEVKDKLKKHKHVVASEEYTVALHPS